MKYFLSIFIGLTLIAGTAKHEFYVSITDLNIKQDTLQVAIKVFTHDLEEVIKDETNTSIFLDNTTSSHTSFRIIKEYAQNHFFAGNAGKKYRVNWVGHEYEADVTWIYAYAIVDKDASLLFVKNTLLTTDRRNQHNMIHMNTGEKVESKICTAQKPEVRFAL